MSRTGQVRIHIGLEYSQLEIIGDQRGNPNTFGADLPGLCTEEGRGPRRLTRQMKKWLYLGAVGVLLVILAAWLITSGVSVPSGQFLGLVGGALIFFSVVALPFAARWALFRTKGRAVLFGVGLLGRVIGVALLVVTFGVALYFHLAR